MKVFDLVNSVLTDTYADIPGEMKEKDAAVTAALAALSSRYSSLKMNPGPSYVDAATRFAYVFRYVTSHANLISEHVGSSPALCKLFETEELTVTCLGGGPGSDLVGVLKHVERLAKAPAIQFYICDGEKYWMDSWGDVGLKLGAGVNATYLHQDATNKQTWGPSKYLRAQLFTVIYFLSELYTRRTSANEYFGHVFGNARKGSAILYIDNRDSDFSKWFEDLAGAHDFELVAGDDEAAKMPFDEQKSALAGWITKFGAYPKLDAKISYRVAIKI